MRRLLLAAVLISVALLPAARLHAQQPADKPGSTIDHPVRISSGVLAGLRTKGDNPVYPENAKAQHIEGVIVFAVIIGPDGHILQKSIISGPDALRDAASTAIDRWTYRPYVLNGGAVYLRSMITINFHIQP